MPLILIIVNKQTNKQKDSLFLPYLVLYEVSVKIELSYAKSTILPFTMELKKRF